MLRTSALMEEESTHTTNASCQRRAADGDNGHVHDVNPAAFARVRPARLTWSRMGSAPFFGADG